jgi:benzoyl-CoA-dihydrodiol lyase
MLLFKSHGDAANVLACDAFLEANKAHWLVNEIRQYWKRVLKRIDVTSRTLVTLVEPGSCFAGTLAELVFAADRSYMLIGQRQGDNRAPPTIELDRDEFRPLSDEPRPDAAAIALPGRSVRSRARGATIGTTLDAEEAEELGLVTFALDDIDWDDEVRVFLEERTSSRPTASPAWKPICASSAPRPWNRKSSRASPRGRTGSSSAPTRSAKTARCAATAPARRRNSI